MLDPKLLRDDPGELARRLRTRNDAFGPLVERLAELERERREVETEINRTQASANAVGKQVGELMRGGAKPDSPEVVELRQKGNELKALVADLSERVRVLEAEFRAQLLTLPNPPQPVVPVGKDENENVLVETWGEPRQFDFPVRDHLDIGLGLGILDFERSTRIAQSRFVTLVGDGAALERALVAFMLDRHRAAGYVEILPPYLVNSNALEGTGQLPKFADDLFRCKEDDLWLIPTAEVPVTNFYREEILKASDLPIRHCAFTPCFRREAGSYGRDTRGLIRLHQFHKVEMVKFTRPEQSEAEHLAMVADATDVLRRLELPYRVLELCTGDLGFSASRCFDLEVWLPSQNRYREISSCSNCLDFQARRANLRFKEADKKGTEFVHTLNGSGLAVGRTFAAILENFQNADGSVTIPTALRPYLGGRERLG